MIGPKTMQRWMFKNSCYHFWSQEKANYVQIQRCDFIFSFVAFILLVWKVWILLRSVRKRLKNVKPKNCQRSRCLMNIWTQSVWMKSSQCIAFAVLDLIHATYEFIIWSAKSIWRNSHPVKGCSNTGWQPVVFLTSTKDLKEQQLNKFLPTEILGMT